VLLLSQNRDLIRYSVPKLEDGHGKRTWNFCRGHYHTGRSDTACKVYNNDRKSFLVGPGGGVLSNEGINQAVVREVREETGLEVNPYKILFVEDLLSRRHRIVKIWLLCKLNDGQLTNT
jgi:8-oxo-dGTP pyrophosphatase MutT (NUDIX family)